MLMLPGKAAEEVEAGGGGTSVAEVRIAEGERRARGGPGAGMLMLRLALGGCGGNWLARDSSSWKRGKEHDGAENVSAVDGGGWHITLCITVGRPAAASARDQRYLNGSTCVRRQITVRQARLLSTLPC